MKHFLLIMVLFGGTDAFAQTLEDDRIALTIFYDHAGGEEWYEQTGWTGYPGNAGESPCAWYGVTCNTSNDRVIGLNLADNYLAGTIPGEIGNLTELIYLDLSGSGSKEMMGGLGNSIPLELGSLTNLTYLNLGGNYFNANNLPVLGKLSKLIHLSITPYWSLPVEIGNLQNLEYLDLSVWDASGMSGLGKLGNIPTFLAGLTKLKTLKMMLAGITGSIPPELGNLTKLELLDLNGNWDLEGTIPTQLAQLMQLKNLRISHSRVSGQIPSEIGNLLKLETLNLESNNLIGNIPGELGNLIKLKSLRLSSNSLSGEIPKQLGYLINLVELSLGSNLLSGEIPAEIGNLVKLKYGYMDYNHLSGTIPDLTGLPRESLSIGINRFTFSGMEYNHQFLRFYGWQANIPIRATISPTVKTPSLDNGQLVLWVDAGGTLSNNTYFWYKNGIMVATVKGNNEFVTTGVGYYGVRVVNSIATGLTLVSNNYNFTSLPVTWARFSAKNEYGLNHLTWTTTAETNNSGFEIERSRDAKAFEKIGFVDGDGDSKAQNVYNFVDQNPFPTSYYRLRQIDRAAGRFDGIFEYSRIIQVKSESSHLSIYPNPARDQVFVEGLEKAEQIRIRDIQGKILLKQNAIPGKPVSTANLPSGLYFITIGQETKKMLIQK